MPINLLLPTDLDAGVRDLEQHIDGVMAANHIDGKFTYHWGIIVRWEVMSDKWVRFDRFDVRRDEATGEFTERRESVYCFVALQDYVTKVLGQVVRGGIYMPATYKAPAKHARGNVLTGDFKCVGPYGIARLK